MARRAGELPKGERISDYITVGVIAERFPLRKVEDVLSRTGRASHRERDLPAQVMMYYVIALALYMESSCREVLRCLVSGLWWLRGLVPRVKVVGKSGISQARSRLGSVPVKLLHDELVKPIAAAETKGAWYRDWRLVSLDGSTMDVADTAANDEAFGRPGASRGKTAYPQFRFVSLVESGTHVLFGTDLGPYTTGEISLAKEVIGHLKPGMLCLADRNFFGFSLWKKSHATGAELLWRVKKNVILPPHKHLKDGSFLSKVYPSIKDRRNGTNGLMVRVVEYMLEGVEDAEPLYRIITTILDPEQAPAAELAALYIERWEIETAFDELKTHLRGSRIVLRSKTPELVKQEFYGLMMAHFAIRGLMHEAALKEDIDPDRLSYIHSMRVIRRRLPQFPAISP
jgi:hypothetical protein